MSVALDEIWSEPLANSPSPPPVRAGSAVHRVDDEEDEDVFRPTKRRRSTLFLDGSDDENEEESKKAPSQSNQPPPDIDALFNDLDDPSASKSTGSSRPFDLSALRRDAEARAEKQAPPSSFPQYAVQSSSPPRDGLAGDGNDDESSKKRQIPKLNEERLLGSDGLPTLVQACKDFKPKGKGHELADLNRLFSLYQFWSHKMYPKTQFSDTVNRIEKLCHSRRMHSALLGWRDDFHGTINGKKQPQDEDIDMHSDNDDENGNEERRRRDEEDVFGPRRENTAPSSLIGFSSRASSVAPEPPISRPPSSDNGDVAMADDDDPFDIDALLRQEEEMRRDEAASNAQVTGTVKTKGGSAGREFTFDENEEAMWAELHDKAFEDDLPSVPASTPGVVSNSTVPAGVQQNPKAVSNSSSSWEDEDAWDVLDEMGKRQQQKNDRIDIATGSGDSSMTGTQMPLSSTGDGSAKEVDLPTANGVIPIDDDDWDDLYV